ncbi:hypothetical protein ACEPAH_1846 [Sanghuangporus vaninii]
MSEVEALDPIFVPSIALEVIVQQYVSVAVLTLLVYHYLLHLDKEVKYFWANPWNIVSIIYFVNQYAGFLGAGCFIVYWVTVFLIDYILTIRVLALYSRDRTLAICLYVPLVLEAVSELGLVIYTGLVDKVFVGGLVDGMTVCCDEFNSLTSVDVLSWVMPMVYGLILLALSLYKAFEYWKMSTSLRAFPLVKVLVEDQIIYYFLVISCCVLRIVDLLVADMSVFASAFINAAGNPTFLCILGSQILINLKEAGERLTNGGTDRSKTISAIQFA